VSLNTDGRIPSLVFGGDTGSVVFVEPGAQGKVGLACGTAGSGRVSESDFAEDLVGCDLNGCGRVVGGRSDRTAYGWADLWWWWRRGNVSAALPDGVEVWRGRNGGTDRWVEFA
jgi:hypothetical protein